MKTIELEAVAPSLRRATRLSKGEVLVLTEKGKPAFALIHVRDELALEALLLSRNAKFMAYLDGIAERARRGEARSLEEARRELLGSEAMSVRVTRKHVPSRRPCVQASPDIPATLRARAAKRGRRRKGV
ncbi:MAG: hypothetical protein HY721_18725 [Planctomycetes bacterium]|nr:hypothetical protein [Planctomycetota bacterium]